MKRFTVLLVILLGLPAVLFAQDIFIPVDPPKPTGIDWVLIIDKIATYTITILGMIFAFWAKLDAAKAGVKADEAKTQGEKNEKSIEAGRKEAKEDVTTQTVALLQAKIAEKPAVVVPVPTIPPVE